MENRTRIGGIPYFDLDELPILAVGRLDAALVRVMTRKLSLQSLKQTAAPCRWEFSVPVRESNPCRRREREGPNVIQWKLAAWIAPYRI